MKDELVLRARPKSNISEDIRTIRTNLQFISPDDKSKVILITSSIPGEGKSFISSNLAVAFSQIGKKTLLIDSDLRLGRIHKVFETSNEKGFANMLVEDEPAKYKDYIKKTKIPDLYIITRGTVPPNPSELLSSKTSRTLLEILKKNFDYIIYDGVPVNGLPDSLILAGMVDRVVLVTSAGYTSIDELAEAKKALEKIDAPIAGVVVNKTNPTKRGKYSNYYE